MLKEIEPEQNEFIKQRVASAVRDLYHELNKPIHFVDLVEKGLHIFGRLRVRAGIALFLLQAQAKKDRPRVYFYTNQIGETLCSE